MSLIKSIEKDVPELAATGAPATGHPNDVITDRVGNVYRRSAPPARTAPPPPKPKM